MMYHTRTGYYYIDVSIIVQGSYVYIICIYVVFSRFPIRVKCVPIYIRKNTVANLNDVL